MKISLGIVIAFLFATNANAGSCSLDLKTTRIYVDGSEQSIDSKSVNTYQVVSWLDCYELATREALKHELGTIEQIINEETGMILLDSRYFWIKWKFGTFLSMTGGKVNNYTQMFAYEPETGDQRFNSIGQKLNPRLR